MIITNYVPIIPLIFFQNERMELRKPEGSGEPGAAAAVFEASMGNSQPFITPPAMLKNAKC